ncbi:GNAT family N-acetyltransferase [Phytoactinopolyspora mesophila]|uniref:GNAT family N-acetyltransferase n=1 Tax=Phytoactinopolyspora mesophila TaxID=2650750 RepID=A0A7K3M728_9ACTN|nr:GNAT family protein [Phytoactinopolyspora mesophila]NDL59133.1 GNAT family N-acetyltransferase [Phytoactinopolyspora mesophila]
MAERSTDINHASLTGEKVRLRALRDDDLPDLCRWWSDPAQAVYQTTHAPTPRPSADLIEMFRGWSKNDGSRWGFSVEAKGDAAFVGHVTLFGANIKDRCAEFAIIIGTEHQDRGYGTDATRLMVSYGFAELGLHRIELGVFGFNERAIAAYARAGFVEEGRRRAAVYRSGVWHDDVYMGLLRHEWERLR